MPRRYHSLTEYFGTTSSVYMLDKVTTIPALLRIERVFGWEKIVRRTLMNIGQISEFSTSWMSTDPVVPHNDIEVHEFSIWHIFWLLVVRRVDMRSITIIVLVPLVRRWSDGGLHPEQHGKEGQQALAKTRSAKAKRFAGPHESLRVEIPGTSSLRAVIPGTSVLASVLSLTRLLEDVDNLKQGDPVQRAHMRYHNRETGILQRHMQPSSADHRPSIARACRAQEEARRAFLRGRHLLCLPLVFCYLRLAPLPSTTDVASVFADTSTPGAH
jgi:hypothetical protein